MHAISKTTKKRRHCKNPMHSAGRATTPLLLTSRQKNPRHGPRRALTDMPSDTWKRGGGGEAAAGGNLEKHANSEVH